MALGISIALPCRMLTSRRPNTPDPYPASTCMLRWVLANEPAAIACEVDAMTDHGFALRVMPLSSPEDGFVELFCTATSALERHADITERLRDAGWHTDHLTARAS
jgi:hypothetical protein